MATEHPVPGTTPLDSDYDDVFATIADSLGGELDSARRFQHESTGDGTTSGYDLVIRTAADATLTQAVYVQTNPRRRETEGVLRLADDETGETIDVWLYPRDPELPSLPAAVVPEAAAVLLDRMRIDAAGLSLAVAAYRPGKRAVIRMTTAQGTLFLKVLRPAVAEPLFARHGAWRAHGIPVPRAIAWAPEGLVALEALGGAEAVTVLPGLDARFLDELDTLTLAIAGIPSEAGARASLATRVQWYAAGLTAAAPESAHHIAALTLRIENTLAAAGGRASLVTIHGDLHASQLFVDPDDPNHITGLLDIDTAGLGDPADDAAALWAHLVVTAEYRDAGGDAVSARAARALAALQRERWSDGTHWATTGDPGFAERAAAIAATHLIGHAAAGIVPVPRLLAIAEAVLHGGEALRELPVPGIPATPREDESALTVGSP